MPPQAPPWREQAERLRVEVDRLTALEEQLRQSEERFRQLTDNLQQVFWLADWQQHRMLYVSPAFQRIWGKPADELYANPLAWLESIPESERAEVESSYFQGIAKGHWEQEYPIQRPDGSVRWIRDRAFPIYDAQGGVSRVAGIAEDITERRRTQEALRESRQFVERIAEASPLIIYLFDLQERKNVYANRQFAQDLGYSPQQIKEMGTDFLPRLTHPEDLKRLPSLISRWETTGDGETLEIEYRMRHADGSWRWFVGRDTVFSRTPEGRVKLIVGTAQDITERKRMEEELRASEEKNRKLLEAAPDHILIYDRAHRIAYINFVAPGYRLEDVLGVEAEKLTHPDDAHLTTAALHEIFAGSASHSTEVRDLNGRSYLCRYVPLGKPGHIESALCVATDITERKRSEQALKESEERFRLLAEHVPGVIYLCRNDARYSTLYLNDAVEKLTGYAKDDFLSDRVSWVDLYHPDDAPGIAVAVDAALAAQQSFELRYRIRRKDGALRWIDEFGAGVFEDGRLKLLEGFLLDVTDRVEAEGQVRESEARYRAIVEDQVEFVVRWKPDGTRTFANEAYRRYFGLSPKTAVGSSFFSLVNPDDLQSLRDKVAALTPAHPSATDEHRVRRPDGTWGWQQWTDRGLFDAQGRLTELQSVGRDITDRKLAEQALRESEERFSQFMRHMPGLAYMKDERLRFLFVNEACTRLYGIPREQWIGRTSEEVLPAEAARTIGENDRWVLARCESLQITESIVHGGKKSHYLSYKFPILRPNRPPLLGGISIDITDRVRAEETLSERQAQYRSIFEAVTDALILLTEDGAVIEANSAACALLGCTRDDLLRPPLERFIHSDSLSEFTRFIRETASTGSFKGHGSLIRADGVVISVEGQGRAFHYAGKPHLLAIIHDVTDRKRLEAQLLHAQKMETVGRLAGGIAHDFNNLLGAIIGYAELSVLKAPAGSQQEQYLQQVLEAAKRGASLTGQLLAFARKQVVQLKPIDLNELVRHSAGLLHRLIGDNIELETKFQPSLPSATVDPGQLEQVLFNLAVNARDAMPQGGKLAVETFYAHIAEDAARALELTPGPYAGLRVRDTGAGMTPEVQAHIFEPFFTTKEPGKGTGLGLATCYGIVKQHQGQLTVESAPGRGSTFSVYLPATRLNAETIGPHPEPETFPTGDETILLVDDEPSMLSMVFEMLGELGYRVLTAPHGLAALDTARAHKATIHLLITDVLMPKLGGKELARLLREERPELKVLFSSGYPEDIVKEHGVLESGLDFIQKPYMPATLATRVRGILDAGR
ncbi:MAG: hypothetical protein AMXMBFR7_08350 [Planctomycetota bacterium]